MISTAFELLYRRRASTVCTTAIVRFYAALVELLYCTAVDNGFTLSSVRYRFGPNEDFLLLLNFVFALVLACCRCSAEALLRQVELAGGSPGSFIAQRVFRHKISKLSYQRGFSQVLIVQVCTTAGTDQGACATMIKPAYHFIAVDSMGDDVLCAQIGQDALWSWSKLGAGHHEWSSRYFTDCCRYFGPPARFPVVGTPATR